MSAPADHADLIARLEAATGPDRELDAAITVALDIRPDWLRSATGEMWIDPVNRIGEPTIRFRDACIPRRGPGNPPTGGYANYTASIDAALTLKPDGFKWKLGYSRYVPCVAELQDYREPEKFILIGRFDGECDSNHAIALCIASLKARAALPARSSMGGAEKDQVHERASPEVTPIGHQGGE